MTGWCIPWVDNEPGALRIANHDVIRFGRGTRSVDLHRSAPDLVRTGG